ncbi:MAG TPA: hypothetical protein GXZ28_03735 [Clostridiales bacterium]|nr:hypothetical protein [Clostridiales bacterium]
MKYLLDANIFFHVINSNIFAVAQYCKNKCNDICITETILNELEPGYYREKEDESTKEIYNSVRILSDKKSVFCVITRFDLSDIDGATEEFKKIRSRFYGWMTEPTYLSKMIEEGKLTKEEIIKSSFRQKDLGECELIAIAKVSKGEYWITTNDKGKVYKHPNLNIFKEYQDDPDINILTGEDWLKKIGYKCR